MHALLRCTYVRNKASTSYTYEYTQTRVERLTFPYKIVSMSSILPPSFVRCCWTFAFCTTRNVHTLLLRPDSALVFRSRKRSRPLGYLIYIHSLSGIKLSLCALTHICGLNRSHQPLPQIGNDPRKSPGVSVVVVVPHPTSTASLIRGNGNWPN